MCISFTITNQIKFEKPKKMDIDVDSSKAYRAFGREKAVRKAVWGDRVEKRGTTTGLFFDRLSQHLQ